MSDKNDVFVGNLAFNTTEEQLKELFSFIGKLPTSPCTRPHPNSFLLFQDL
jgi:RNA recognition motif-containing protein